jgi:hypothetical protein
MTPRILAVLSFAGSALVVGAASVPPAACGSGDDRLTSGPDGSSDESNASGRGNGEAGPPCTAVFAADDAGVPATVSVDTSTLLNTFVPKRLFGINTAYWIGRQDVVNTQAKVQAAGNYLVRYPGGSQADDYHWNGAGTYDADHRWVPSDTSYSPGFQGSEKYRGTTSVAYSTPAFLTDGDTTTSWLSNADTAFPNAQWVYVDLGQPASVSSVQIVWGTPYATSFEVQTWSGAGSWPPPYQATTGAAWQSTSAGIVTGMGGTQAVLFTPATTEFVRVLMTASSGGATGRYSIAELTVRGPASDGGTTQLTTNMPSPSQSPTVASTTDPANDPNSQTDFDFEPFMDYVHSFTPTADPIITVNVGTGTPQEAAAWVHYANVVRGYGIRYWQIGNEMEGNWETGGPLNAQEYVKRYIEYYDAMKAVDPTVVILGPVSGGPNEPSNLGDGNAFVQDFIGLLHAAGLDDHINAIDYHWYPNYGPVSDETALATVAQIGLFASSLNSWLSGTLVPRGVPVFLSEYNIGINGMSAPLYSTQLVNGVWLANVLGEYARHFGNAGATNLWNMIAGSPDTSDPTQGDLGYLQHRVNEFRYQEHADYWAMQMMSSDWAISGDTRDHRLVSSRASDGHLATYADLRPDGALALAVINTDTSRAYSAAISVAPFVADAAADVWTFDSRNYVWETSTAPYHASPDSPPSHALTCGVSVSVSSPTPFTFAPESVTVIRFAPVGGPWAPTTDGGAPDSPTTTVLIDDMSAPSGAQIRLAPQRPGDIPGSWYTFIGGGGDGGDVGSISPLASNEITDGGTAGFYYTALGADGGIEAPADAGTILHAACTWGETPAAQYAYAAEGFSFEVSTDDAGVSLQPVDISKYTGFQFWAYNARSMPALIRFQVQDKESVPSFGICGGDASTMNACYSPVFEEISLAPGWGLYQVPYAALAVNPYYGYPQPAGGDMGNATNVEFEVTQPNVPSGGAGVPFGFCIADIRLYE